MYDVIVLGLGPAGSTAAYHLGGKGLEVLAVDKAVFPRYKSCGGCISVKVPNLLDFDISDLIEETVFGATFTYRCTRPMDIISDRPVGYNVMRDRFDHRLVEKAKEQGVKVLEGRRVCEVLEDGDGVSIRCEDGETFQARFLVGADGASGPCGRFFRMNKRRAAVSITAEVPYNRADFPKPPGRLFIDFGGVPFGYGWIFPKKDFLSVGIAGDTDRVRGGIKNFFDSFVKGHEVLRGFDIKERVGWTVPTFYEGAGPMVRGRVLLAGDAGHLVDPFLGEGIYYAILTAKKAAGVIWGAMASGSRDLSPYQQWLEKEVYPEFHAAGRIGDLVYNHPRLWYRLLEKDPNIMYRYYDVIRGDLDGESFYRWIWSMVRSKPWKVLRGWLESRFLSA